MANASGFHAPASPVCFSTYTPTRYTHTGAVFCNRMALAALPMAMALRYSPFMVAKHSTIGRYATCQRMRFHGTKGSRHNPPKRLRKKAICTGSSAG